MGGGSQEVGHTSIGPQPPTQRGEVAFSLAGDKGGQLLDRHGLIVQGTQGFLARGGTHVGVVGSCGCVSSAAPAVVFVLQGCMFFVVGVVVVVCMESWPPRLRLVVLVLVEHANTAVLSDPVGHLLGVDPQGEFTREN